MKYSQAVAFIAVAFTGVIAQDLSGLPQCAQQAALAGISSTGCSLTDIACICKSTSFLESVQTAIKTACSPADQAKTIQFAANLCQQAGVTIPTGGESSAAASSTEAASSSAPASSSEMSTSEAATTSTMEATTTAMMTTTAAESTTTAAEMTTTAVVAPSMPASNGTIPMNGTATIPHVSSSAVVTSPPSPTYSSGAIAQAGSILLAGAMAGLAVLAL